MQCDGGGAGGGVKSLQESKHQEWNHSTVVTLHQYLEQTSKCHLCLFSFPRTLVFLSQLPGCKYRSRSHYYYYSKVKFSPNIFKTNCCTFNSLFGLDIKRLIFFFFSLLLSLLLPEAWDPTLPSWIRCRPYLFLWIPICLSACACQACECVRGRGLSM